MPYDPVHSLEDLRSEGVIQILEGRLSPSNLPCFIKRKRISYARRYELAANWRRLQRHQVLYEHDPSEDVVVEDFARKLCRTSQERNVLQLLRRGFKQIEMVQRLNMSVSSINRIVYRLRQRYFRFRN